MRFKVTCILATTTALTAALLTPELAFANTSIWGAGVGPVHSNDGTSWCVPTLTSNGATTAFNFIPSDPNKAKTPNFVDQFARQKVRVSCKPVFGSSTTVTSASWSTDAGGDKNSATCPAGTTPQIAQCQVDGQIDGGQSTTFPYVYSGSACGTGVSSISTTSSIQGELLYSTPGLPPTQGGTSFTPYMSLPSYPAPSPLPHGPDSGDASPFVGGADIGGMFLSADTMNFFFGDSYNIDAVPPASIWYHGSLAKTTNLDPTALVQTTSGLQAWELNPNGNGHANSLFAVQPWGGAGPFEDTTIPGAGFGVTDQSGNSYRFLWFFSVQTFGNGTGQPNVPITTNWASLAWSINGGAWTRGDANPAAPTAPVWPAISNFSPGAVWYDRVGQMIYFFGIRPQLDAAPYGTNLYPFSGVRVAKVPSNPSSIMDPTKYAYWSGSAWVNYNTTTKYAVATPQTPTGSGGLFGTAADIIPSAVEPRSEMSVAYNAEAGSFIMMFVNMVDGGIRLYQSTSVTGPWSEVLFDTFSLPNSGDGGTMATGGQKSYGPFTNDQLLVNGGKDVYYTLSEFTPVYNVGLWHYAITASSPSALCN